METVMNSENTEPVGGMDAESAIETADPGTIVWHTSDGEGGPPDVAYQVILAKGESLWIGEITRDRYEDAGGEQMSLGGDGGWWLIHYKGRDATVLGKVNYEQASDLADLVSGLVKAALSKATGGSHD